MKSSTVVILFGLIAVAGFAAWMYFQNQAAQDALRMQVGGLTGGSVGGPAGAGISGV